MPAKTIFDVPVVPTLKELLCDVQRGTLRIPYFQRPFVWDDERRLMLLDSVAKGFSIGSLLVWRTHEPLKFYPDLGGYPILQADGLDSRGDSYVLDGHQRLVTLYTALMIDPALHPTATGETLPRLPIYVELAPDQPELPLEVNDQRFHFWKKRGDPPAHWLALWRLFDEDALEEFEDQQKRAGKRVLARQAKSLANRMANYSVPVIPYLATSRTLVAESITRLNTASQKMSELHVAHALLFKERIVTWDEDSSYTYTETDLNLLERMAQLQEELRAEGWGLVSERILLNTLKLEWKLPLHGTDPRDLEHRFRLHPDIFVSLAENTRTAIGWMRQVGVLTAEQLPSAYQLIGFVQVAKALQEQAATLIDAQLELLWKWFWQTGLLETFTGTREYQVSKVLENLRRAVTLQDPRVLDLSDGLAVQPTITFQPGWVRSRCLALLLQEQARGPNRHPTSELQPSYLEALLPKRLSRRMPATYVMVRDADELRRLSQMLDPQRTLPTLELAEPKSDFLHAHGISEEALHAAHAGNWERFSSLRQAALHALERDRTLQVGLSFSAQTFLSPDAVRVAPS